MNIIAKNENDAMFKILCELNKQYEKDNIIYVRGLATVEIMNLNLTIENFENAGLITEIAPSDIRYVQSELDLYKSGSNKLKDFAKISKFWNKISDDGETIRSAYGYILYKKHGFNQVDYCVDQLKKDKYTRKAVLTYKTPYNKETKDNICTLSQQFYMRDNKLHTIVTMRSNDIFLGFRNDLAWFRYLQYQVALRLGIEPGLYHHNVGSLHLYENHFDILAF